MQKQKERPKKRKRDDDLTQDLLTGPSNEAKALGNLDFNEELDEEVRIPDVPLYVLTECLFSPGLEDKSHCR